MSDSKKDSTKQRRQSLKKILAGTGAAGVVASAPEKWVQPVVNSVTLPSHAATSLPLSYTEMGIAMAPEDGIQELLIPTAHAGGEGPDLNGGSICVNFNADMQTYMALVRDGTAPLEYIAKAPGTVNTPYKLTEDCSNEAIIENLYLILHSGPSNSGIPYSLCRDSGGTECNTGTLLPADCSTTPDCTRD